MVARVHNLLLALPTAVHFSWLTRDVNRPFVGSNTYAWHPETRLLLP
jgi:hypothetical protein